MTFPIRHGALVVSCQAREDNPLHGPVMMAAMARAADQGGAGGIRANGARDIAAIRAVTRLPIIGIVKRFSDGHPVYITPDIADAEAACAAGADLIAIDATPRPRDGPVVGDLVAAIHLRCGVPVMADVSTLDEGLAAARLGVACVATTLSGYTEATAVPRHAPPDLALVEVLARQLHVPVIAEGRYDTPDLAAEALRRGAHAVVVGTAITNPCEITRRFAQGMERPA